MCLRWFMALLWRTACVRPRGEKRKINQTAKSAPKFKYCTGDSNWADLHTKFQDWYAKCTSGGSNRADIWDEDVKENGPKWWLPSFCRNWLVKSWGCKTEIWSLNEGTLRVRGRWIKVPLGNCLELLMSNPGRLSSGQVHEHKNWRKKCLGWNFWFDEEN